MDKRYTVFIIDGAFVDYSEPYANVVRLDNLSRDNVLELMDISIDNGHDFVVREYETADEADEGEVL